MNDLAIVLVHYRTPALLVDATRALLVDLEASRLRAEILVVDNGSAGISAGERAAWRELPVRWIDPGMNLGYAGGVRRGVEASSADRIVAMNPDVLVVPGCLARLQAELERGAAAAGPQFFWDIEQRLFLPPTEPRSPGAEVRAALARRFPSSVVISGAARRSWRRHARRHWEATEPFSSAALSGALIAFRRDAWTRIGPFDEAFRLYFEETDWLLRLADAGLESRFVPAAHAVHLFAQSSIHEPRAATWFAEAERLFRRRHLGGGVVRLLEWLGAATGTASPAPARTGPPPRAGVAAPVLPLVELSTPRPPEWIEIALAAGGFPAAGERLRSPEREWAFSDEVWRRLPPSELWVRGIDDRGRESAAIHLSRGAVAERSGRSAPAGASESSESSGASEPSKPAKPSKAAEPSEPGAPAVSG